jgi:Ca2+-binding EF-hand superfamily protein
MDRQELRETFDHFDADGNGTIEKDEFLKLLEALGAEMEPDEAAIGFDMIDRDDNQRIDFEEFASWWLDR